MIKTPQTHPNHHVVGRYFGGFSYKGKSDGGELAVYYCDSYDTEIGYWMTNVEDANDRRNVSERAINATFYEADVKGDYFFVTQWGSRVPFSPAAADFVKAHPRRNRFVDGTAIALLVTLLSLATGCCCGYGYRYNTYSRITNDSFWTPNENNVITVVNSTTNHIRLIEDGRVINDDMAPGDVVTEKLYTPLDVDQVTMVAISKTGGGTVDTRIFELMRCGRYAQVWRIHDMVR